ncbi:hypothetical protein BGZ47_011234 [Haplosporangium gracile]|nr:hypothetical protein BGZ47_011234 [Haplosporangium gracile]
MTPTHLNNLLIPEIIDHIASFLTPPDLLKAILVSHEWNLFFTPRLWHTIDDYLYAWPRILGTKESKNMDIPQVKELAQTIIMKYHRHIRHLHIGSTILVDAAAASLTPRSDKSSSSSSWNIRKCSFRDMRTSSTRNDERVHEKAFAINEVKDFLGANTDTLLFLTIDYSFLPNPKLEPHHPLFEALRGQSSLVYLNCGEEFRFRLSEVPDCWPRLISLITYKSAHNNDLHMTRPVPGLRSLVLHCPISLQSAVHVLGNLPDLEHLKLSHILYPKDSPSVQQTTAIDLVPHTNIKSLNIGWLKARESETYWSLFSTLPFLTTLKVNDLEHDTSKAIATHCPQLEVLVDYKKPKVVYTAEILHKPSTLEPILQSCSNIRVLDALGHQLVVSLNMETPWATTKLEILRCQIRGLNRLDQVEEEKYSRALDLLQRKGRKLNAKRTQIMQRHQVYLDDHTRLYTQLARQTKLQILELGFDHRVQDHRCSSGYSDPIKDTPELSLASGLSLLSGLKEMKIFGFEGFDHRIGMKELDWMAESWPGLRMLRGLEGCTLSQIRVDEHNALLRKHLCKLRPEVKHESLGAYDVYAFWQ